MKKIIALLLVVAMMAALFVGCNNTNVDDTKDTSGASESKDTTPNNDDKQTEGDKSNDEIVELTWYQVGSGMPANYDAWKANLDKYLEEKIGVHLDVVCVSWGDWDSRRNVVVSTNEPYDIMFTNNGTYASDVDMGAFLDITELVKTASPDLYSYIPEDYWNACAIDGKIYGVPTYKDSSLTNFFVYDKDLVEATGLDYENVHNFQDVTAIVAAMSEELGGAPVHCIGQGGTDVLGNLYDGLGLGLTGLGISYYDTDGVPTVVPVFEQEDAMENLRSMHSWYANGYTNSDAAQLAEAPTYAPFYVAQGWPSAALTTWGGKTNSDYTGELLNAVAIQIGDTVLSNDTVQGSISCISSSCKNPEKALQLLELVNTDSYVRDSLYYGLEGDQWDYVEVDGQTKIHKNDDRSCDWTFAGYTQGTFFNVTMLDTETINQWEEVKAQNEVAVPSPALGFACDTSSFVDELGACKAIWESYKPTIWTGTADPDVMIPQMMAEMRDSGFDTILAEVQRQLTEWYNATH